MIVIIAERTTKVYGYGGWTDNYELQYEILGYCQTEEKAKEWITEKQKDKKWRFKDWYVEYEFIDEL
jgi:hypothetical protein